MPQRYKIYGNIPRFYIQNCYGNEYFCFFLGRSSLFPIFVANNCVMHSGTAFYCALDTTSLVHLRLEGDARIWVFMRK